MAAKKIDRDTELAGRKKIRDKLLKLYSDIEEGFRNQAQRADDTIDYWDAYNCQLGGNQYYQGTSKIFVPIIHDAVKARKTRFTNQIFPKSGRYVDVVSQNGEEAHAETALLEHYVRKAKLRTEVAPSLCVNGDVEGQYSVYCAWSTAARHVVWKTKKPLEVDGVEMPEGVDDIETIEEDVVLDDHPIVEVLSDSDVLILPVTCNSVEQALESGGSVTIIRRWTKGQMRKMIDDGDVDEEAGEGLLKEMGKVAKTGQNDPAKAHADAAGITAKGKVCQGYETWTKLKVGDDMRLCVVKYGSDEIVLSCKLNPYWSDRCPLISVPVDKVAGVAKGISQVAPCLQMQLAANDAINEGMDSAAYALLPIIMTDPLKNPRVNTMVLDLAAVWETNPNDTKFATFPQLWKEAFEIVSGCKQQVFQTLGVNPAMMPQGTGGKQKRNQAEIANEQQVDILTTADAVTVLEEGIFTPVLERFAEMDAQFRDDDVTVKAYGYMGVKVAMERIPPLQMGRRYSFVWNGVEQARNAAQVQQQIAFANVLRGVPPHMIPGRRINMVPILEHAASNVFGARLAPLVFEDTTKQFSYPAERENEAMELGHMWPVSVMDDDVAHMEIHQKAVVDGGDAHGQIKSHMAYHRMQMLQKAQAQAQQQNPQTAPGTPGGAGPGVAGVPRPGGQVANPRQNKQPAGALHPDQMGRAGAVTMPRRA